MKATLYLFVILALIVTESCKNGSGVTFQNAEYPDSVTMEEKNISEAAATEITKDSDNINNVVPPAVKQKKSEIIAVKIATSMFFGEGCCKENIVNPKACCCDEILKQYTLLWKNKKWDEATKARNDEILNRCRELNINNFAKKLKDLEQSDSDDF